MGPGRRLLFLFDAPNMWGTSRFPSIGDAAVAFTELRAACAAAGLGSPYLVFMGWDPAGDAATARALGFDALSTYAVYGGSQTGAPYSELAATARATWVAEASTGLGVVPGLGAGWDPRPRIETPTPWATYADIHFEAPTPEELGDHVEEGLAWVDAHAAAAPARAVVPHGVDPTPGLRSPPKDPHVQPIRTPRGRRAAGSGAAHPR